MNKIFHKPLGLYQEKKISFKETKLDTNSTEPSEQATNGKAKALQNNKKIKNPVKPIKGNINNKKFILNPKNKEEKKVILSQNFEDNPKIKNQDGGKIREKSEKAEKFYLSREIALTVEKYGRDIFSCVRNDECKFLIPTNFMDKHSLSPNVRERMVDWMVEVFSVYKCDPGTFELAVHIMDSYISKCKKVLQDEDIHLIGLTCIYISSKIEDIIPLRMSHIVKSLGHSTFTEKEIMKKEKEIIKIIDFDFFTAGTYDYIMTFFYDLKVNNAKKIRELNGIKIVEKFLNFSIFLSQLLLYHIEFVCFRQSLNALAVLALAFDILKTNIKDINKELKNFLSDWVFYVINEMGYVSDAISIIYKKIYNLYKEKVILPQKAKENKNGKLFDDDDEIEIINLCKFNQDKFI